MRSLHVPASSWKEPDPLEGTWKKLDVGERWSRIFLSSIVEKFWSFEYSSKKIYLTKEVSRITVYYSFIILIRQAEEYRNVLNRYLFLLWWKICTISKMTLNLIDLFVQSLPLLPKIGTEVLERNSSKGRIALLFVPQSCFAQNYSNFSLSLEQLPKVSFVLHFSSKKKRIRMWNLTTQDILFEQKDEARVAWNWPSYNINASFTLKHSSVQDDAALSDTFCPSTHGNDCKYFSELLKKIFFNKHKKKIPPKKWYELPISISL